MIRVQIPLKSKFYSKIVIENKQWSIRKDMWLRIRIQLILVKIAIIWNCSISSGRYWNYVYITYEHGNHAFRSLLIERRIECFVKVAKCKQDSNGLSYSQFTCTTIHGYCVNIFVHPSLLNRFFKKWAIPGLFFFTFFLFKQTLQFLHQINVKNVHPVYSAGIRTPNHHVMSLLT